ncbi:hypothetical protein JHK82_043402 [Glycine max]|nr:hypothetical protein JHK82_043402 [Glycine max]
MASITEIDFRVQFTHFVLLLPVWYLPNAPLHTLTPSPAQTPPILHRGRCRHHRQQRPRRRRPPLVLLQHTAPIYPWPRRLTPTTWPPSSLASTTPTSPSKSSPRPPLPLPRAQPLHALFLKLSRARRFYHLESLLTHLPNPPPEPLSPPLSAPTASPENPSPPSASSSNSNPSAQSLNALLNALVQNKRHRLAHSVFKSSTEKFRLVPNVVSCNILLKALCKRNEVDVAVRVLDEMSLMGLVPNVVSYSTVLGGFVLG